MSYLDGKEEQIASLLRAMSVKKMRAAAAEIGTGGMMAQALASASEGAAGVFQGGTVLANKDGVRRAAGVRPGVLKKYGMGSKEIAAALAVGICPKGKSGVGIGVSGSAGDSGSIWAAVFIRERGRCWIAFQETPPSEGEGQREQAVLQMVSLLEGYFANCPEVLALFAPGKKYLSFCRPPFLLRLLQFFIPWPGDKAWDVAVKLLLVAAVAAGGWAVSQLSSEAIVEYHSVQVIERAVDTMTQPPTREQVSSLPEGYLEKFAAAYEVNPEIVGWLTIPNTNINLPVMQHEDNDFYLDHNFEGEYDTIGVPFMDFRNKVDELYNNTLIYGHNWESGQMFHSLLLYKDVEFYKENPVITFDTVYEESQWKVIACFEAVTDSNIGQVFNYWNFLKTKDPERVQKYIDDVIERSYFLTTVDTNPDDYLLTIQTCANDRYDRKICLVARKLRPGESGQVDVEGAEANPNRLRPVIY